MFFRDTRNDGIAKITETKNKIMKLPFTPVKKAVGVAACEYMIEILDKRNTFSLANTNVDERIKNIDFIMSQMTSVSDDKYISTVRESMLKLEESSLFRKKVLAALDQAEKELEPRRSNMQKGIAVLGAALLYSNPYSLLGVVGFSAICAYATNKLSPVSNELLEIYDSTGLIPAEAANGRKGPCSGVGTSYYRMKR